MPPVEKVPDYGSEREMKRVGNLYDRICSVENLVLADKNARKGKTQSVGVRIHDARREENIRDLHLALVNKTFKTSPYHTFMIHDPKDREIYQLPYYPDRIVHHAVMNVLEPIWMSVFSADTYSCIKGRGIHAVVRKLKEELKDHQRTIYTPEETPALFSFYREDPEGAAWIPGEDVALNATRTFGGKTWKCIQAHKTLEGWEPDKTPALWQEVVQQGTEIPVWIQPTGGHDAYNIGAKVHYPTITDPVYESLINGNVWSPVAYPAGWRQL